MLPKVNNLNIEEFLSEADMVKQTAEQIMKDFALFGIEITFSGNTDKAYFELHDQLIKQVSGLIQIDYPRLLSILYQVDITEREIAKAAEDFPNYNEVELIAHQIIVRELKKVVIRTYIKNNPL